MISRAMIIMMIIGVMLMMISLVMMFTISMMTTMGRNVIFFGILFVHMYKQVLQRRVLFSAIFFNKIGQVHWKSHV